MGLAVQLVITFAAWLIVAIGLALKLKAANSANQQQPPMFKGAILWVVGLVQLIAALIVIQSVHGLGKIGLTNFAWALLSVSGAIFVWLQVFGAALIIKRLLTPIAVTQPRPEPSEEDGGHELLI